MKKMKYSFMSFSCPNADIDKFLSIAKTYGYDGIEPRIDAGHKHGVEPGANQKYLQSVREKAADAKIKICCIASSCQFADADSFRANVDHARRVIELAHRVGAPAVRVFGGGIKSEAERSKSRDLIVEALSEIADEAAQAGVYICAETHDSWHDPRIMSNIMKQVNKPYIAVNWDIMHPVINNSATIEESFELLSPWIKHVHAHDGVISENGLRLKTIGEGAVDHKAAVKLLKNMGYGGFVSGEWIDWEPYETHLPRELAKLKSFE
jgi:sugar phosphate isomerase/epimerase